ncbi:MAG: NUDIX domain-containing protein [Candidatus Hydrogenedentes bacterium]|nr:NUDIX domain-containing protein [Candidatus Hydrogenedentota bacterium]
MKTKYHKTAGGVVLNGTGQVLALERHVLREGREIHEIRLPKGHIDAGETPEAAGMREVCEESGYCRLEIIADLGTAHSAWDLNGKHHEREERYFLMRLREERRDAPQPTPGSEEALFEPLWLPLGEAATQMTYESEREFVQRAIRTLDSME